MIILLILAIVIAMLFAGVSEHSGGSRKVENVENFKPLSREYLEVLRDRLGITIKENQS